MRQVETVSSRPKFLSMAFDSWQAVMQYMIIVRYMVTVNDIWPSCHLHKYVANDRAFLKRW